MIDPRQMISLMEDNGVDFYAGVPDSLLKDFCAYVTGNIGDRHVVTANEGGAVALAAGHYLATGKMACVYMQNSGQGNAVNPLASLADPDVYSIPMVLLVGWRGEPGKKDEPQHVKQGKVTIGLMETLGIPAWILPDETDCRVEGCRLKSEGWKAVVAEAVRTAKRESRPVALIVKKGLFEPYRLTDQKPDISELKREDAIEAVLETLGDEAVIVSTTGMISRELYEIRERRGEGHGKDFLTVGSMGHALMIALGVARDCNENNFNRYVVCLDGDGASIMQMGNMAVAGRARQPNLIHIVLNNAAHDSVGGQPTVGGEIDFCEIAKACGYYVAAKIEYADIECLKSELRERIDQAIYSWACDPEQDQQTTFIEIKVAKGARANLGRPKEPPQENKKLFMETLANG